VRIFPGPSALTPFEGARLLQRLQAIDPGVTGVVAGYLHVLHVREGEVDYPRLHELLGSHLDLPPEKFSTDVRLQEIDLGTWDGLTHKEAKALDPAMYKKREHDKWNVRVPGGESYADVAGRAERWLAGLKRDTFAVSHGCFTRVLRGLFAELSAEEISELDEPQGVVFRVRGSKVKRFEDD